MLIYLVYYVRYAQGRDASTRLTRSLKAQKLRESIPSTTEVLKQQLEEWTAVEGMPFLYDGHDYMVGVGIRCAALVSFEKLQKGITFNNSLNDLQPTIDDLCNNHQSLMICVTTNH